MRGPESREIEIGAGQVRGSNKQNTCSGLFPVLVWHTHGPQDIRTCYHLYNYEIHPDFLVHHNYEL